MEDALPPSTATATAVTAQTMVSSAATTVVTTIGRIGSRNGTHRTVNVHGRLMYDEIVLNDVWINAILSTLAFTCAACLCVCFLYCKFQQWKHAAQLRRDEKNSRKYDNDSLPSYTIVTGLPTYDEAVERMNNPAASKSEAAGPKPAAAVTSVQVYVKDERGRINSGTSSKPAAAAAAAATAAPAPVPAPAVAAAAAVASMATVSAIASTTAARGVADPTKRFGLVSHCIVAAHDSGCSHCLSVQELLETYDVR